MKTRRKWCKTKEKCQKLSKIWRIFRIRWRKVSFIEFFINFYIDAKDMLKGSYNEFRKKMMLNEENMTRCRKYVTWMSQIWRRFWNAWGKVSFVPFFIKFSRDALDMLNSIENKFKLLRFKIDEEMESWRKICKIDVRLDFLFGSKKV